MSTPYDRRPLSPAPDRQEWAEYERQSRRAAAQYEAMPIAHQRATAEVWTHCIHCTKATRSRDGQCRGCKRTVVVTARQRRVIAAKKRKASA